MQQIEDDKENIDPQPMSRTQYVRGTSSLSPIIGGVRDRGILLNQTERHKRDLRVRITRLARYMRDTPQPGPLVIEGSPRYYYGDDYEQDDLEEWLHEVRYTFCEPMTHDEYHLFRTARLTMMRTMLDGAPGILPNGYPALWHMFGTMGELLDTLTTWPHHVLTGQISIIHSGCLSIHGSIVPFMMCVNCRTLSRV